MLSFRWRVGGMRLSRRSLVFALVGAELLIGQSSLSIVGSGYSDPSNIDLAPFQVTTLYLRGVKSAVPRYVAASGFPLPFSLAGLSVSFRQFSNVDPIQVPILAVRQLESGCPDARLDSLTLDPCRLIAVTIQVPDALIVRSTKFPDQNIRQELIVSENGNPSSAFRFNLLQNNIRVLTDCGLIQNSARNYCTPKITHADGILVQGSNPAQPGEILVVYALGLGGTTPTVPAGSPAPLTPATLPFPLLITVNFNPNAPPGPLAPASATMIVDQAIFAGLTPGFAGLYQVNFRVPMPPAGTPACLTSNILSNATVTLLGSESFDGASFCVQVPPAPLPARTIGTPDHGLPTHPR